MKKMIITKNSVESNVCISDTQEQVMDWFNRENSQGTFGQPGSFEYEIIDITEQLNKESLVMDKIAKGKAARQACEAVLDLIGGYNIDRNLTFAQKNEMKLIFSDAKQALNDFQPSYAKYFINMIEADGILVTAEMKTLCMELLADY